MRYPTILYWYIAVIVFMGACMYGCDIDNLLRDKKSEDPKLWVSTNHLRFTSPEDSLSFSVRNAGGGLLEWTVIESLPWIEITKTEGMNTDTIGVFILADSVESPAEGTIQIISSVGIAVINVIYSIGGSVIGPVDPPYTNVVTYPSGLELYLEKDAVLTGTYPDPNASSFPFGSDKTQHYERVGWFVDVDRVDGTGNVSENFTLEEYTRNPSRNGDRHTYFDAQIALHVQEIRSILNTPLILNSTYRSPRFNDTIGGALFSRHMYGDALDVNAWVGTYEENRQFAQRIFTAAQSVGVDFIEPMYLTVKTDGSSAWVHIDDRGF